MSVDAIDFVLFRGLFHLRLERVAFLFEGERSTFCCATGKHVVTFGVLFDDDECANLFEVRRRAARFCVDAARRGALLSSRQPR